MSDSNKETLEQAIIRAAAMLSMTHGDMGINDAKKFVELIVTAATLNVALEQQRVLKDLTKK
jgi:hypothetical protein